MPSCRALRPVMRIEYGAQLPLSIEQAFDFVSNPANWPAFFDSISSAEALEGWGAPGGRARMVNRVLGREVVTDLELLEWDRPHGFRYVGHTAGRPDMDNNRAFAAVPGGTRLTGTTSVRARRGLAGLLDVITALAVHRIYRRAMAELPSQAAVGAANSSR